MKIVGHAAGGRYLLEATEDEIAKCVGWTGNYDEGWRKLAQNRRDRSGGNLLAIGIELNVAPVQDFFRRVHGHEQEAVRLATNLTALAALLTSNLPTSIIPAAPPPAPAPEPQPETAP